MPPNPPLVPTVRAASLRSCDTMSQLELSSSAGKEDTRSSMEDHPFHRVSLPA